MKTLNAILPNAGVAAAYRRELDALIDDLFEAYRANLLSEIVGMAASGAVKAADAKPKTPEEAEEVFKAKAAEIAAKFAKKAGRHVEAGLIQAMKKAGFSQADLRRLRQDKTAYAAIEQQIINNNVALITRIPADVEAKIRKMVERSIEKDRDLGGLVKELDTLQEMTHRRSKFISIDQNNKITNQMSLLKVQSLGITDGIWMHRGGAKVPRPTHLAMHGQKFNLAEGLFDEDEGYFVLPGQMYNCHCAYKPVLPDVLQQEQPEQSEQPVVDDLYSQERKDNALQEREESNGGEYKEKVDNAFRSITGEIWKNAPPTMRNALYGYTNSAFEKINALLNGFEKGSYDNAFLGAGKVPLKSGGKKTMEDIRQITTAIGESLTPVDIWVYRGVGFDVVNNIFGDILRELGEKSVRDLTDLSVLENEVVLMNSFISTSTSKDNGFHNMPITINFYVPKGAEALYVEPFSRFGKGDKKKWDGTSKQLIFGEELELLLQRGAWYRVTRAYKEERKIYIDVELRLERGYNKYEQED